VTDEQPQDQIPDPADGANSEAAPEDDLDALLAEASSLAGELSEEVGTAEVAAPSSEISQAPGTAVDPGDNLDAQLAELEELARTTGSEIGAAPEEPSESVPQADYTPSQDSAPPTGPTPPQEENTKSAVPVFMDEFTRPEEPQAGEPPAPESPPEEPPAAPASPAPPVPGVINSETVRNLPSLDDIPSLDDTPTPKAGVPEKQHAESDESQPAGKRFTLPDPIRRVAARLSPTASVVCERSVSLLETIDRPLGRIGENPRRVIGYVAIATFTTSLIVLLISLF